MSIMVNNKKIDYVEQESVQDLLKRIKYTFPLVIVKINGKHIPRDIFMTKIIPDNSDVQVIHMISGG
jgi:sulfur carrier protein